MEFEPMLDLLDPNLTEEQENELSRIAAEQFLEIEPDWEKYASWKNKDLLKGWIFARGGCISLANLQIAFRALVKDGTITPAPLVSAEKPMESASVPTRTPLYGTRSLNMAEHQLANKISPTPETDNDLNTRGSGILQKNLKELKAADKTRGKELMELEAAARKQRIAMRGVGFNLRRRQGLV